MYNRNSVIECATNCLPAILPVEQKNQWKSVFNNDTALGLVRKAKSNYLNCKMAEKQKFFRLFVYEIRSAELFLEKKPKERLARQEELDDYIKFAADESKRVDEDLAEDSIDRFGFKEPTQALEYSTRKAIEFIKKIRSDITEEKGSLAVELMKKQQKKRLWSEFYLKQIFKAKKEYDQGPTEFEPVREHTINRLKLFDNFLFAASFTQASP